MTRKAATTSSHMGSSSESRRRPIRTGPTSVRATRQLSTGHGVCCTCAVRALEKIWLWFSSRTIRRRRMPLSRALDCSRPKTSIISWPSEPERMLASRTQSRNEGCCRHSAPPQTLRASEKGRLLPVEASFFGYTLIDVAALRRLAGWPLIRNIQTATPHRGCHYFEPRPPGRMPPVPALRWSSPVQHSTARTLVRELLAAGLGIRAASSTPAARPPQCPRSGIGCHNRQPAHP